MQLISIINFKCDQNIKSESVFKTFQCTFSRMFLLFASSQINLRDEYLNQSPTINYLLCQINHQFTIEFVNSPRARIPLNRSQPRLNNELLPFNVFHNKIWKKISDHSCPQPSPIVLKLTCQSSTIIHVATRETLHCSMVNLMTRHDTEIFVIDKVYKFWTNYLFSVLKDPSQAIMLS